MSAFDPKRTSVYRGFLLSRGQPGRGSGGGLGEEETGTRLRPQRPGGSFFKRSKKWQTSRVTGHLFLLFFFLFSFFL